MNEPITFLLGYPLSIIANLSTTFVEDYFDKSDTVPLRKTFLKAFYKSLNDNKSKVDKIGKKSIAEVEKQVKSDEKKLFTIFSNNFFKKYTSVDSLRSKEVRTALIEVFMNTYNFNHIRLAKNVLEDCLRNYEVFFYSEMTAEDGIQIILNLLKKLDSDLPRKRDINNLKEYISKELSKTNTIQDENQRVKNFILNEITSPEEFSFSEPIIKHLTSVKKIIAELTKEQYQIIHYLRYHKRVIISGCAGSGKTLLAVEKGLRLDNAGIRTLILTHNPYLVNFINALTGNSSIKVDDFTNFVYDLIGENRITLSNWSEFIEPTEDQLLEAIEVIFNERISFDAIIVDEGQDFRDTWWLIIEGLSNHSENKIIYIFYDDHQSLLPYRSKYPFSQSPFTISKNCRNSGNIFKIVQKFHDNAPLSSKLLQRKGIVKLSLFHGDDYKHELASAVFSAKEVFTNGQIALITNEPSIEGSILIGVELFKPDEPDWSRFVENDLKRLRKKAINRVELFKRKKTIKGIADSFGIPDNMSVEEYLSLPILDGGLLPSKGDIALVTEFANKLILFFPPIERGGLEFIIESGKLKLVFKQYKSFKGKPLLTEKIKFYSSSKWAESLPEIKSTKISLSYSNSEGLNLYNITSFKGLESECVILFVNTFNNDIAKELYIGTSRAIGYLHLVVNKTVYEKLTRLKEIEFKKG